MPLRASPRDNVKIMFGRSVLRDVDSLFKGEGLHVLVERKRRISSDHQAPKFIIAQIAVNCLMYRTAEMHIDDLHKEGDKRGAVCDVRSMLFAEAADAAAIQTFLDAGIPVLTLDGGLRFHLPPVPSVSPLK